MDGFMMWLLMSLVGASHAVQYVEMRMHIDASCSSAAEVRVATAADVCGAVGNVSAKYTCSGNTCQEMEYSDLTCSGQGTVKQTVTIGGCTAVTNQTGYYYKAELLNGAAAAWSSFPGPVFVLWYPSVACSGPPYQFTDFGDCTSVPGMNFSSKQICNATASGVSAPPQECTFTAPNCPATPAATCTTVPAVDLNVTAMGVCTVEDVGGFRGSKKMLCNQAPYVVPQENTGGGSNGGGSNGGGGGSSEVDKLKKLSAGDDVGIILGVLAVIAIAFMIGAFVCKSKQETKGTEKFLGGDDM